MGEVSLELSVAGESFGEREVFPNVSIEELVRWQVAVTTGTGISENLAMTSMTLRLDSPTLIPIPLHGISPNVEYLSRLR